MKLLFISLILAFTAHSALGFRRSFFPHTNIDMKRIMYAAGGTVQCDMCEMIVKDVQSLLSGQEDEIENLLDSLCEDLPAKWRSNCTDLVNTYLPLLFTLIDDMSPTEVCELLTLCQGEETDVPEITGRQSLTAVFHHYMSRVSRMRTLKDRRISYMRSLVGEGYLCGACEDAIGFVHDAVACNQTWGEIAQFFLPLCELCPADYRAECQNFFDELPGDVNEFADEYLDPQADCEILGFCRGDELETTPTEEPEPETEVEEPVPELTVPIEPRSRIEVDMNNRIYDTSRYTKKQFKDAAKAAKANKKNMRGMGIRGMDRVRRPRSMVVRVAGQTEEQVPYDVYDEQGNHYETVPAHKKCEVCRYFSSAAEGVLQYNEEDITNGLTILFEDICTAVPEQFQDECESEIEDVVPGVIYQMLLKVMNPDYLCTEMIPICE